MKQNMKKKNYKASAVLVSALAGAVLMSVGMGSSVGSSAGPRIEREGDSAHSEAMQAIETQPFDIQLFDGLDGWTLGDPISAESIQGKVVLIGVVAVDHPKSIMSLSSMARMERKNADKGLVVLAVHPENGWDEISEKVNAGRVKVQVARDVEGKFFAGVQANDYPDLFLIDRAGQLRYADITNKSLKLAVSQLLRETPEQAIANAKDQANGIEVAVEPEAKTAKAIPPAKYTKADWPAVNTGKMGALNLQGKALPVALGNEEWLTEERDLTGKILVLDFWATWCGPCKRASPTLEKMQIKHKGKIEVLAIGGPSDDEAKHKKYVIQHDKAYSNLYDKKGTINSAMKVRSIPHTIIISTDGVIRWQGNPLNSSFTKALDQVVAADPMFAED
jgi:cytochrome c biogenesis protein CcmG, thiol:disulfide interchange protein DsbE